MLSAAGLGPTASAQEESPSIAFVEIDPRGEYIVIENIAGEEVDLSGYNVSLEVGQRVDQIPDEPFPDGTTLPADERLTIVTGTAATRDGDIDLGYRRAMINNTEPDTLGISNPDNELATRSDNEDHFVTTATPTPESTEESTVETTEAATDAPTEAPTAESTQERPDTSTAGATETPTREPTTPSEQTPTDSDCDRLTNSEEKRLGTDPDDTDSDGDGWSDLSEINRGSDPLDPGDRPG